MGVTFWPTTWFKHVFAVDLQGWLVVAFDLVVSVGDQDGVVGVPSEGSLLSGVGSIVDVVLAGGGMASVRVASGGERIISVGDSGGLDGRGEGGLKGFSDGSAVSLEELVGRLPCHSHDGSSSGGGS